MSYIIWLVWKKYIIYEIVDYIYKNYKHIPQDIAGILLRKYGHIPKEIINIIIDNVYKKIYEENKKEIIEKDPIIKIYNIKALNELSKYN